MFLDLAVAAQIEELGINVRESFTITRKTDGQKGSLITWEVVRTPGEQPNGTLVVPAPDTPLPKPPTSAATPDGGMIPRKLVGSTLADEANALVDSFAQVLEQIGRASCRGRGWI